MKKGLLLTTCMAALLGVGVFAGVNAGRDAKEVRAETLSGKMYLQINGSPWNNTSGSIVLHFSDGTNKAWGTKFTPDGTSKYNEYSYSIGFVPTKVKAYVVNQASTVADWIENEKDTSDWVWAYTSEQTYHDVFWLDSYDDGYRHTNSGTYTLDVNIKGGSSDDWSSPTIDTKLTSVKISNSKDKIEAYGLVTIPKDTYFKAYKAADTGWYETFDAEARIKSRFSNTGTAKNNILDSVGGTYEIYFKFDEGNTLWITDPISAAADEWAQNFTKATQDEVPGCTRTRNAWANLRDSYNSNASKYSTAFTSLFVNEAYHAPDYEGELSFIGQAMQRYDLVLQRYGIGSANTDADGYQDFVGRAGKIPSLRGNFAMPIAESSNNGATIAIIVAFAAVTAIGGFVFFKKKKLTK